MLLVIINNLDVRWSRCSVSPLKADPPLIINPNAALTSAVAYQASNRLPGNAARSLSDVAASIRSSFRLAGRSNPENVLTRFPEAKSR